MAYVDGFAWAVPTAFLDALGQCRFERGDTLYDTPKAYEMRWSDALTHIKNSVQVRFPEQQGGAADEQHESNFESNWFSELRLDHYGEVRHPPEQVVTTQGRLYTLLWRGDVSVLDAVELDPPPPLRLKFALENIRSVRQVARQFACGKRVFVMPIDRSVPTSRRKLTKIARQLGSSLVPPLVLTPQEAGLPDPDAIAPTIGVALCAVRGLSREQLYAKVEAALLTKGNRTIILSAHGEIL